MSADDSRKRRQTDGARVFPFFFRNLLLFPFSPSDCRRWHYDKDETVKNGRTTSVVGGVFFFPLSFPDFFSLAFFFLSFLPQHRFIDDRTVCQGHFFFFFFFFFPFFLSFFLRASVSSIEKKGSVKCRHRVAPVSPFLFFAEFFLPSPPLFFPPSARTRAAHGSRQRKKSDGGGGPLQPTILPFFPLFLCAFSFSFIFFFFLNGGPSRTTEWGVFLSFFSFLTLPFFFSFFSSSLGVQGRAS